MPVVVHASSPIRTRMVTRPMFVEFAPGWRYFLREGPNQFYLPPGAYRLQMFSSYFGMRVGTAELDIDTRQGQVFCYYAAPYTIYSSGTASFEPCNRPGKSVLVGIFVGAYVVVALAVALAVVFS